MLCVVIMSDEKGNDSLSALWLNLDNNDDISIIISRYTFLEVLAWMKKQPVDDRKENLNKLTRVVQSASKNEDVIVQWLLSNEIDESISQIGYFIDYVVQYGCLTEYANREDIGYTEIDCKGNSLRAETSLCLLNTLFSSFKLVLLKAEGSINSGWKKKANLDLWQELLTLNEKLKVKYEWVKGHAQNKYNNECDRLAVEQAESFM